MKIGDLIRITYRDGAITYELGVYLGESYGGNYGWKKFFLKRGLIRLSPVDYSFEVVSEQVRSCEVQKDSKALGSNGIKSKAIQTI